MDALLLLLTQMGTKLALPARILVLAGRGNRIGMYSEALIVGKHCGKSINKSKTTVIVCQVQFDRFVRGGWIQM